MNDKRPPKRLSDAVLVEIKRKIGHMIYVSRQAAAITQEELASAMGLSGQSIRDWESGRREPTTARIVEIGQALDRLVQGSSYELSIMAEANEMIGKTLDSMYPGRWLGLIPYTGVVNTEDALDEVAAVVLEKEWDDAVGTDAGHPFPQSFIDLHPHVFAVRVRGKGLVSIGYEPGTVVFINPQGPVELGIRYLAKASGDLVFGTIQTCKSQLVLAVHGPGKEPRRLRLVLGQEGESDSAEVLGAVEVAYVPGKPSAGIEQG